jgi:hypothetical protein
MRQESRGLDDAVIGRDDGKGFWMGQGVHRGTWTNHRVSNPATGSGIHWEKKIISASGKSAPRLLLKRLAPPKAAIVARRTRGYQSLLLPRFVTRKKDLFSETPPPKLDVMCHPQPIKIGYHVLPDESGDELVCGEEKEVPSSSRRQKPCCFANVMLSFPSLMRLTFH